MIAMVEFLTLVITTMFAVAAAAGLDWLFLHMTFLIMRPATARRMPVHTELVRGTAELARAADGPARARTAPVARGREHRPFAALSGNGNLWRRWIPGPPGAAELAAAAGTARRG